MFTDMDWWTGGVPRRPYNWMFDTPLTSVDRWYFLAHERDQFLDFDEMQAAAVALDVSRYGACVQVESATSSSYGGRHFLSTNLDPAPAQSTSYHGCPVVDAATPMQTVGASSTPVLKPVWDYMLLHDTPPLTIESDTTAIKIIFSPGMLEQSEDLTHCSPMPVTASPLSLPFGTLATRRFYRLPVAP